MSKKFTEEQYHKIINNYERSSDYVDAIRLVLDYIDGLDWLGYEEAMAIANPLTRELAHDKFVKKEKKYYWTIKVKNKKIRLYKGAIDETVKTYVIGRETARGTDEQLTESEVRECGYRLDLFDREEV